MNRLISLELHKLRTTPAAWVAIVITVLLGALSVATNTLGPITPGGPADPKRSYGYHRGQVLAAFVNGALLIVIVAGIAVEAVQRLLDPVPVEAWTMLAVAVLGLVVNVAALLILHGGDRRHLNLRGAAAHVLGDLLGSSEEHTSELQPL